jgi:hypothetical protein
MQTYYTKAQQTIETNVNALGVQRTSTEARRGYGNKRPRIIRQDLVKFVAAVSFISAAACSANPPTAPAAPPTYANETFTPTKPPSVSPEGATQRPTSVWSCAKLGLHAISYPSATEILSFVGTSGFEYPGDATEICDNAQGKSLPSQFLDGTCNLPDGGLAEWSECQHPIWVCDAGGSQSMGRLCRAYQVALDPSTPPAGG